MTVLLDRVQLAVVSLILSATAGGAVAVWAPAGYPERALGPDVITAEIVRGPLSVGHVRGYSSEPTALRWTVSGATAGERVGLGVTGARFWRDVGAGETDTDVRDGLLAVFQSDPELLPGVTPVASGADSIDFDASGAVGRLWGAAALGPSASIAVLSEVDCEITTATARVVVELQAYSDTDALGLLAKVGGVLVRSDISTARSDLGVALNGPMTEPINLRALVGADWRARAASRLTMALRSYSATPTEIVEDATLTGTTDIAGVSIEVTTL